MCLPRKNIYTTQSGLWVLQLALPALQESWALSAWPGPYQCPLYLIWDQHRDKIHGQITEALWQLLKPLQKLLSVSVKWLSENHGRGKNMAWQKEGLCISIFTRGGVATFIPNTPTKKGRVTKMLKIWQRVIRKLLQRYIWKLFSTKAGENAEIVKARPRAMCTKMDKNLLTL